MSTRKTIARVMPLALLINRMGERQAETDSAKTNEFVQRKGSELPVDQRSSYLRSRQIALKKFSLQGGDPL